MTLNIHLFCFCIGTINEFLNSLWKVPGTDEQHIIN